MTTRPSRRAFLSVAFATVASAAVAACSSGSGGSPGAGSASGSGSGTPSSASRSSGSTGTATWVTPRTMPAGKGSGAADGAFPRTVVHFEGSTTLAAPPKRVVVISTGQADALLTLGIVPVGSTAGDGAAMIPPYLTEAFPSDAPALRAVASVGSRFAPTIESVANAKPDLILMNIAGKDAAQLYKSLSAVAPTVATQGTGLYWKQDFLLLADAVGKTQQAQRWLTAYQDAAAAWGEQLGTEPTVSFLRKNGDRMRIFGVASFAGSVAEDAGLARPKTQQFTTVTSKNISAEKLDQADGDWLMYAVQGGSDSQLTSSPLWPTLTAVTAEHAVPVDDDVFYLNTGPTAANQILATLKDSIAS